ncbi:MAG: transketolase C-terminal domain-containing protein [Candidatus Omnitrophota bacterium]|nr:transketolase C-terminal domain-containing protein [Candidatus Omnitrophota bacterium]
MRNAYLTTLHELAKADRNVIALISDNGAIVYDKFRADFPDQYLNCGISEANMIGVSAGLASCGKIPFAYTISNFLVYRAYEQIRNDVCLQKMNVKLVGIGVGFVYSNLGPTHHGTEDIAVMRCLPNMTIFSPADAIEARNVTMAAAALKGPVYIRLATGGSPVVYEKDYDFVVGQAVELKEGTDITLMSTGSGVFEVLKTVRELEKEGISAGLLNFHTIKPIDRAGIVRAASKTGRVLVVEEQNLNGGFGSAVAEVLIEEGVGKCRFGRMGLCDKFAQGYGTYDDLKAMNGLSKAHIVETAKNMVRA